MHFYVEYIFVFCIIMVLCHPLEFYPPLPEDIYCILGWLDSHANCYVCITWPVLHPTLQGRVFCPVFQSPVASEFFS